MWSKLKKDGLDALFLLPSILGVSVFVLIPFIDVIRYSFINAIGGQFLGTKSYQTVLQNEAFLIAVKNTFRFICVCIPLLLVISLILALSLQEMKKGKQILKSAYLLPMAVPIASVVFVWKILFHKNGLVNGIFHIEGLNWMGTDYAFYVLVGSYIWKNLGYHVVLWMAGLSGISRDLYEAAGVDGAGTLRKFINITLPGLRSTGFTVVILAFLNSFKVFREAYLVAGDYPHQSMYLLQHVFNNWFRELSLDKLSAGAVLTALFLLVFIILLKKVWGMDEEV